MICGTLNIGLGPRPPWILVSVSSAKAWILSAVTSPSGSSYSAFSKYGTLSMARSPRTLNGYVAIISSSIRSNGTGFPSLSRAYLARHAASSTSASRNILWPSARAALKGACSWPNRGEGCLIFAKCAAWPASWKSVVKARWPLPTAFGSARDVKFAVDGCQVPPGLIHATCGQWQNPLEYLFLRSSKSKFIVDPSYCMPILP